MKQLCQIPIIFAFEAAFCLPLQVGNFYLSSLGKVLCWGRCWFNN